jgi:hypothetical protein
MVQLLSELFGDVGCVWGGWGLGWGCRLSGGVGVCVWDVWVWGLCRVVCGVGPGGWRGVFFLRSNSPRPGLHSVQLWTPTIYI